MFLIYFRHGHWFHQQLLARSLSLFQDHELLELERELQTKLSDVRVIIYCFYFFV